MIPKFISKPILIVFALILLLALALPQNFVILAPGPTTNLLGSAVTIKNANIYPDNRFKSGALFSTTVYANNPDSKPLGIDVLQAWLDGNLLVVPWNAVYEKGEQPKVAEARKKQELVDSQANAALAALNFIRAIPTYAKPTWQESDVQIVLNKVGGGSAGLAFALALIAKSTDPELIGNRKIAVTGTISQDGKVGPIGGLDQKVIAASRSGAQIFVMPKSNCSSLSKHPTGLKIYAVANLSEAVHALAGANNSAFGCSK